jgi:hypothetical protein
MDPKHIPNITMVAQEYKSRKTKKGTVKDGPYWFGYWMEKGKSRRVYIGKELPKELQAVLDSRTKPPGRTNYSWPGRAQAS